MMRRGFQALCLAFFFALALPVSAQAPAELLDAVGKRLANPAVLRGDFEQTRTLKGFKRPLVSHGSFVIARERGLLWVTREPFPSTVVITRDRLLTLREDGSRQQLDARQQPGLRAVNEMLVALLGGDLRVLAGKFGTEGALQGAKGWRLVLTPKDPGLAAFIARIELEGEQQVNLVTVHEAAGDASRIRFSGQAASALTPAETGQFAP